jgi:hypothetical protein
MVVAMLLVGTFGSAMVTAAQETEEGFLLGASTTICPDEDFLGPFYNCEPWDGVIVSFVSEDGTFSETCVTDSITYPNDRVAQCVMRVPYGSTIIASIDASQVPDGYYLFTEPVQEWLIPDEDPTGLFGGPAFVIIPDAGDDGGNEPGNGSDVEVTPPPTQGDGSDGAVTDDAASGDAAAVTELPSADAGSGDAAEVTSLPSTGAGEVGVGSGGAWLAPLLSGIAVLLAAAAMRIRLQV